MLLTAHIERFSVSFKRDFFLSSYFRISFTVLICTVFSCQGQIIIMSTCCWLGTVQYLCQPNLGGWGLAGQGFKGYGQSSSDLPNSDTVLRTAPGKPGQFNILLILPIGPILILFFVMLQYIKLWIPENHTSTLSFRKAY